MYVNQISISCAPDNNTDASRPATIEKLPPELLREVFLIHAERSSIRAQVLCSVCGHWRDLALHIPQLWTDVTIYVANAFPRIPILSPWIERSGNRLLDINISMYPFGFPKPDHSYLTEEQREIYLGNVFKILSSQCHRWWSFQLFVSANLAPLCDGIPMESAVMLKYINVEMTSWGVDEELIGFDMIAKAPALRSLTISDRSYDYDEFPELDLNPWAAPLGLDLSWRRDWGTVAFIIPLCTSALWMKLDSSGAIEDPDDLPDRIFLPNIRLLSVSGSRYDMLGWMHSLDCPNLSYFHVFVQNAYESDYDTSDLFAKLVMFLGSGQHNLRSFKIELDTTEFRGTEIFTILKTCLARGIPSVEVQVESGEQEDENIRELASRLALARQQDASFSKLQLVSYSIEDEAVTWRIGWSSDEAQAAGAQAIDAILEEWDGTFECEFMKMMPNPTLCAKPLAT